MSGFLKRKLADPLAGFLKQGISPHKLALAVCLGFTLATIPVFGASTLLCLLVIWIWRLNPATVLLVNQLTYPLQFALYFPFIRAGEWLFNTAPLPLSITQIFHLFKTDLAGTIATLWWSTLYGIVAWMGIALPLTVGLFFTLKKIFSLWKDRLDTRLIRNTDNL